MTKLIEQDGQRYGWRGALVLPSEYFNSASGQTVTQTLTFEDSDTFYGGTITQSPAGQTVTQSSLFTDSDTFYTGALSARISQSALYTDSDTFYTGSLAQTLSGGLYTDADTFYGGTVTGGAVTVRPVVSGKQAQADWEARQKWRKQAEAMLTESVQEPVQETVSEKTQEADPSIGIDSILPRLYEPVESLAELVADARLLQLDEARALESAMAVKDVLAIAELAYLAEVAVQQEKDAIAAFIMFMD